MVFPRRVSRRARGSRAGISILDLLIAFSVLLVALGALLHALGGTIGLSRQAADLAVSTQAVRAVAEELQTMDVATAFAQYNGEQADDVGLAPGDSFAVDGLQVRQDDADGEVGEILFPVDPFAPGVLTELADSAFPGMPRDLNLDGDPDDDDVTPDFKLLPVIIRVRWADHGGRERSYELRTLLSDF